MDYSQRESESKRGREREREGGEKEVISTSNVYMHASHKDNISKLIKYRHNNTATWYIHAIPAFGKLRQEGQKFRVIPHHLVSLRPPNATLDMVFIK